MTVETRSDFARRLGMHKSSITRLAQDGRIVINDDGLVEVEASLELIQQTKGNRDDVAARHAAQRAADMRNHSGGVDAAPGGADQAAATSATHFATGRATSQHAVEMNDAARAKALAESRRVIALADQEEMERDRLAGNLIAREDVDAAMKFIGATVRSLMDVFPDQVSPLVAPLTDIGEVQQVLADACRNVLVGLGESIRQQQEALSKSEGM